MRASGDDRDRGHRPRRQHHLARHRRQGFDDLLDRDERSAGREHGLLLHAGDTPHLHVALGVGALGVNDRDVGLQCRHGGEHLAGEWAGHRLDVRGAAGQVGAAVAAQDGERKPGRAGNVAIRHAGMAVLFQLQRPGPVALDRVAKAVQRADARVAAPGEDEFGGATGADELVVDEVGRHPDEGEIASALPDDLVAGGERNQMRKAFERNDVAVVDQARDRLGKRGDLGRLSHRSCLPSARRWPLRPCRRASLLRSSCVLSCSKRTVTAGSVGRSRKRPVDAVGDSQVTFSI